MRAHVFVMIVITLFLPQKLKATTLFEESVPILIHLKNSPHLTEKTSFFESYKMYSVGEEVKLNGKIWIIRDLPHQTRRGYAGQKNYLYPYENSQLPGVTCYAFVVKDIPELILARLNALYDLENMTPLAREASIRALKEGFFYLEEKTVTAK